MVIASLYGPCDNLTGFTHPAYGRSTSFLDDEQLLGVARRLAQEIVKTGRDLVVVAESGATPLARICERLLTRSGAHVDWEYVKFPREPTNVEPVIAHYLNDDERAHLATRLAAADFTRSLPPDVFCRPGNLATVLDAVAHPSLATHHRASQCALAATTFARTLSRPFVYFDEYLDSGTTLWNAYQLFSLFAPIDFKTLSYFVNVDRPADFPVIATSLYDPTTKERCFDEGAYPFENRLDLVGHFFFSFDDAFGKVTLDALVQEFSTHDIDERFLDALAARSRSIAAGARVHARLPAVRERLSDDDGMRFLLSSLERAHGTRVHAEFLWQLFEMYGPIWSPLPDESHRDFLQAFAACEDAAERRAHDSASSDAYRLARPTVIGHVAHACKERHDAWERRMNALLEVPDEHENHS